MKRSFRILAFLLLLQFTLAGVARSEEASPAREVLDNGMTVILLENHRSPVVTLQAWVGAGLVTEAEFMGAGVSHFMAEETPQFIGEFEDVPVDPKGRLILPAAFRKVLPLGVNSFVIARWFDGCLAGFEPTRWKQILRQLLELGHLRLRPGQ